MTNYFRSILVFVFFLQLGISSGQGQDANIVKVKVKRLSQSILISLDKTKKGKGSVIAVMDFDNIGKEAQEKKIGETVAELLNTSLGESKSLKITDRRNLKKLTQEMALGQSGLIDSKTAVQAGSVLGADIMIVGSVGEAGDFFNINARILETATGEVLGVAFEEIRYGDLIAVSSRLYDIKKFPITASFRSMIMPGWGQFANDRPRKGGTVFVTTFLALGAAAYFNNLGDQEYDSYLENSAATVENYDSARDFYNAANISLGIAGAFWFFGVIDAYFTARSFNKGIDKYSKKTAAIQSPVQIDLISHTDGFTLELKLSFDG